MDNYVGKRLDGRYEVQEIIGVGGMSVVYKAYDLSLIHISEPTRLRMTALWR